MKRRNGHGNAGLDGRVEPLDVVLLIIGALGTDKGNEVANVSCLDKQELHQCIQAEDLVDGELVPKLFDPSKGKGQLLKYPSATRSEVLKTDSRCCSRKVLTSDVGLASPQPAVADG